MEVVFTVLHAGGKFGGGGYKVSGGLHGVGASVVNALSEWLEVDIYAGGKIYHQRYERGHVCYPLRTIGECDPDKTGTKISFLPDKTIFEEIEFDYNVLKQRMREIAFLTKNLKITLRDLRPEEGAIENASDISLIKLPDSVTFIDEKAFWRNESPWPVAIACEDTSYAYTYAAEKGYACQVMEPVLPENVDAMVKISHMTTIPIASGERLFTTYGYRELIEKQAVSVVQPDVCHCGGILQTFKIAAMAQNYYMSVAPHNPLGPVALAASCRLMPVYPILRLRSIPPMRNVWIWVWDCLSSPL